MIIGDVFDPFLDLGGLRDVYYGAGDGAGGLE